MKFIVLTFLLVPGVIAETVPAELTGTWIVRKGTGANHVNQVTGQSSGRNATVHCYTFRANGQFEYAMLLQSSLHGCTTAINGFEAGHFSVEPGGLKMVTERATKSLSDNCRPELNERSPADIKAPEVLRWRVFRTSNGAHLCMARAGGKESCFLKQ